MSVGMLDSSGFNVRIEGGIMKVIKGSLTVMKGHTYNGLYILEVVTVTGTVATIVNGVDKTRLWHLRLGHISEKGLAEISKQGLLCGDKTCNSSSVMNVSWESAAE